MIDVNEYIAKSIIAANDAEARYTRAALEAKKTSSTLFASYMTLAHKAQYRLNDLVNNAVALGLL